jgi:hypothetical protein
MAAPPGLLALPGAQAVTRVLPRAVRVPTESPSCHNQNRLSSSSVPASLV